MKICAIICEYNPFHNGHLHQLREAKRLSKADAILCLMSGNFVQRGEAAVMEKRVRARHAIQAGADIVLELPTPFATSNAELFAKGAVHILASIPDVSTLCFGAELADKDIFLKAAKLLNDEPKEISLKIKELTATGLSYAKARAEAWSELLPPNFLTSPNNILGVEYARAILSENASIELLPIPRLGSSYKEEGLGEGYASATAIRNALSNGSAYAEYLPDFVAKDLPQNAGNALDCLEKYAVLSATPQSIARVCDCTEGLENAFKKAAEENATFAESLTSARYTASRIRRIALQTLLKIEERLIREGLRSPLYLRVLAIKKEAKALLSVLSEGAFPLLLRAHDEEKLENVATLFFEKDLFAENVHALLYKKKKIKQLFI